MRDTFRGFTCWRVEDARRVLDIEALQMPPEIFSAVHYPVKAYRISNTMADAEQLDAEKELIDEKTLLQNILNTEETHLIVPVVGRAGTGKSHLIRWLYFNTPREPHRHVHLIPRAGANLRDILLRLLEGFAGEPFDTFRKKLQEGYEDLSPEQGRTRLLDRLAELIEHRWNDYATSLQDRFGYQTIEWVVRSLPAFLRDPISRPVLLREGGIIARIYDMTLGKAEIERVEKRRKFTIEDLPHDLADLNRASYEVQKFFRQLVSKQQIKEATIAILNTFLEPAIRALLNMQSADLLALMRGVRRELARQNKVLLLFIEDIAHIQGIDQALLEALIERPVAGDEPLCPIYTVIGATDGYYRELPDTFRSRCSYLISLNLRPTDLPEREEILVGMAARYLNAARVGTEELKRWYESGADQLPSKCVDCPLQEPCFEGFGSIEIGGVQIGLYPFNQAAIKNIYARVVKLEKIINPRMLIREVLRPVLITYYEKLKQGAFPPPELRRHVGGISERLTLEFLERLKRTVPSQEIDRHQLLFDLWAPNLEALPSSVYEAFGLTPPVSEGLEIAPKLAVTRSQPEPDVAPVGPPSELPKKLREHLGALEAWGRGEALGQTTVNELRDLLFQAIVDYINWDAERLLQKQFAHPTNVRMPFCRRSINFEDQTVQRSQAEVELVFPLKQGPSRLETALALQGLLLYQHYKSWSFDSEGEREKYLAVLLRNASREVIQQLRWPRNLGWNPVRSLAYYMKLGAWIQGYAESTSKPEDYLEAWYTPWTSQGASSAWKQLTERYAELQRDLRSWLEAYTLCPKGGSEGIKVLDTIQFLSVLCGDDDGFEIPENLGEHWGPLQQVKRYVERWLSRAVEEEWHWWKRWWDEVHCKIGNATLEDVKKNLRETLEALQQAGALQVGMEKIRELQSRESDIQTGVYERICQEIPRILSYSPQEHTLELIPRLGRLARDVTYAEAIRAYVQTGEQLLNQIESYLDQQLAMTPQESVEEVIGALRKHIQCLLDELGKS